MAIPLEGSKKIVGITGPCSTEEVTTTPLGGGKIGLDVNAVVGFPPVGVTVVSFPFVAVPPAAVLPLPPPGPATLYTVTVLGATAGDVILVRKIGDPVGTGVPLIVGGGSVTFGGLFGAISPVGFDAEALATNVTPVHAYVTIQAP
ncbi:MAG: hypothetical protein U0236_21250 [Nitrospira sp.]